MLLNLRSLMGNSMSKATSATSAHVALLLIISPGQSSVQPAYRHAPRWRVIKHATPALSAESDLGIFSFNRQAGWTADSQNPGLHQSPAPDCRSHEYPLNNEQPISDYVVSHPIRPAHFESPASPPSEDRSPPGWSFRCGSGTIAIWEGPYGDGAGA